MLIGNREWLSSNSVDLPPVGNRLDNFERQGSTVVLVAVDGELCISYYNHVSYECEVSVCVCKDWSLCTPSLGVHFTCMGNHVLLLKGS